MTHHIPLTPTQQQIVHDLLASGRFRSEDEIIGAAFRLLADRACAPRHEPLAAGNPSTSTNPRRSPYGLLADIRSDISAEDIDEARREMWAGFPRDL
jgi:Arc/MetJ-type ribon-helix-helix transcriptional regulator